MKHFSVQVKSNILVSRTPSFKVPAVVRSGLESQVNPAWSGTLTWTTLGIPRPYVFAQRHVAVSLVLPRSSFCPCMLTAFLVARIGNKDELTAAYCRVAAISIAAYEALWTLPAEISIYRDQIKSFPKISRVCVLFFAIRYSSFAAIIVSNVGFFSDSFTEEKCRRYHLAAPAMKATQCAISQVILGLRTIAIGSNLPWVRWVIGITFFVTVVLQYFSNLYGGIPHQVLGNCTSGNMRVLKIGWVHYLSAMIFDATCLSIATAIIYRHSRRLPKSVIHLESLSRMLMREGIIYFAWLTAVNVLNLILYLLNSPDLQSSGETLGYAITFIMSQRLLIHLHEYKIGVSPAARAGVRTTSIQLDPRHLRFRVNRHQTKSYDFAINTGTVNGTTTHDDDNIELHCQAGPVIQTQVDTREGDFEPLESDSCQGGTSTSGMGTKSSSVPTDNDEGQKRILTSMIEEQGLLPKRAWGTDDKKDRKSKTWIKGSIP